MQDVLVGLLAIIIGAMFCFRGFIALRVMIPIWGALAGFMLGAGIVAGAGDDGFLRTAAAWIVGIILGMLFGLLAYLYYEVSIILAMASIGFTLGTGAMVALGVSWNWVIVLVGVIAAMALAYVALVGNLPGFVLIVLGALAGATSIVAGAMLLGGVLDTADFTSASVTERIDDSWWWYALYVALAVVGIFAQLREIDRIRMSTRQAWIDAGGRELRHH